MGGIHGWPVPDPAPSVMAGKKGIHGLPRGHTRRCDRDLIPTRDVSAGSGFWPAGFSSGHNFRGVIQAPNGFLYTIPFDNSAVWKIDPVYRTAVSLVQIAGSAMFNGGCLAPNGKIYGTPFNSVDILEIDPRTDKVRLIPCLVGGTKWVGFVVGNDGMLYALPRSNPTILRFDPNTGKSTFITAATGYSNGEKGRDGRIYCVPISATRVQVYDPQTKRLRLLDSYVGSGSTDFNQAKFCEIDGNIYCTPFNNQQILAIDTKQDDRAYLTGTIIAGGTKWGGIVEGPDRAFYLLPHTYSYTARFNPVTKEIREFGQFIGTSNLCQNGCLAVTGEIWGAPSGTSAPFVLCTLPGGVGLMAMNYVLELTRAHT